MDSESKQNESSLSHPEGGAKNANKAEENKAAHSSNKGKAGAGKDRDDIDRNDIKEGDQVNSWFSIELIGFHFNYYFKLSSKYPKIHFLYRICSKLTLVKLKAKICKIMKDMRIKTG